MTMTKYELALMEIEGLVRQYMLEMERLQEYADASDELTYRCIDVVDSLANFARGLADEAEELREELGRDDDE